MFKPYSKARHKGQDDMLVYVIIRWTSLDGDEIDKRFYWHCNAPLEDEQESFARLLRNMGIRYESITSLDLIPMALNLPNSTQQVQLGL